MARDTGMLNQRPIKRRKISEEVADRIEQMIQENGLKAGDTLPSERDIMVAYDVGRSAVREAFFALTKRGLVEIRNGERAKVASPDVGLFIGEMSGAVRRMLAEPDGVRNFQDARRLFETGVAARAAERAAAEDIDALGGGARSQPPGDRPAAALSRDRLPLPQSRSRWWRRTRSFSR